MIMVLKEEIITNLLKLNNTNHYNPLLFSCKLLKTRIISFQNRNYLKEFDRKSWGFIFADQIGDWRIRQILQKQVFLDN